MEEAAGAPPGREGAGTHAGRDAAALDGKAWQLRTKEHVGAEEACPPATTRPWRRACASGSSPPGHCGRPARPALRRSARRSGRPPGPQHGTARAHRVAPAVAPSCRPLALLGGGSWRCPRAASTTGGPKGPGGRAGAAAEGKAVCSSLELAQSRPRTRCRTSRSPYGENIDTRHIPC